VSTPTTDLSFDPCDPYHSLSWNDDARWALQVFTPQNVYVVDPDGARVESRADGTTYRFDALALAGRQRPAPGGATVDVSMQGDLITWNVSATHPECVKAIKLLLRGAPARAFARECWSAATGRTATHPNPSGTRFQWTYPGQEWATPWACSGAGDFTLSTRDPEVRPKRLHVHVPPHAGEPVVELVVAQRAACREERFEAPPIRLRRRTDVAADLGEHCAFLEQAYGLTPLERRADAPAWLEDVALVVTLHGQHWTGYLFNSFRQMEDALRFVARHIEGRRVLVYLPGWEGRYYHVYPDYRPGAELGGEAGWLSPLETARGLGFRVMPMFGAHGANLARYADWQRAAFTNDTGRYLTLLNAPDWDGDRTGEGDQIFLNPGEPGFRAHLTAEIVRTVDEYGVDAVFLDTAGFWFDDPRHDQLAGYRAVLDALHGKHPELLVAAEGWWDALLGMFPLAQQWLGVDRDLRYPELLTRYARTTAHLAEGAPGSGSTGVHEGGYRPRPPRTALAGHIPSISIVDDTLARHANAVAEICRWADSIPVRPPHA
jgi:hypothetical protein